jgi:radical SAM protein with 4Fe4S-binding SPASM domain
MCFQTVRDDIKNGMMEFSLFQRIMDEVSSRKPYSIRLSWRGECLLHPEFNKMLGYARSVYSGNISFLTNGLKLDAELFDLLIRNKIDYIVISADGVEKTYNEVRRPGKFQELVAKLALLQEMKRKRSSRYPMVRINTVSLWFKDDECSEFNRTFLPFADKLLIGSTLNTFSSLKVEHDSDSFCASPWQRLLIAWNGEVYPCCSDYVGLYPMGNITTQTLADIWHGPKAEHIRKLIRDRRRLELQLCREIDCGVDEIPNDSSEAFVSLVRRQVEKDVGPATSLLKYLGKRSN